MDIHDEKQYNDASQLYLYTVHVIEEINKGLENITPSNYTGAENGLYYHKGICIGARSPKINKNRPPSFLTEPLLKSNINGSHSFSFKMPRFYYDLSGNKVENNLITYLHNETRLLLQYYENIVDKQNFDDSTYIEKTIELEDLFINNQVEKIDENIKTLVFVIKNITEDITGQFFEFECNDIYINELSKIGSQIVMDTELQNNIGSAQDLIQYALDESNSDWVFEGMEANAKRGLYNFIEQPIVAGRDSNNYWYLFGLSDLQSSVPYLSFFKSSAQFDTLNLSKYIDETTGLFNGGSDFVFHSPIDYTKDHYEITYSLPKTTYKEITASANNNFVERIPTKICSESGSNIITTTINSLSDIKAFYEYHGEFLTPQEKTLYDKQAKQFVTPCYKLKADLSSTVGKRTIYYRKNGYLVTDGGIDNFVSNPNCYSNTNGWKLETNSSDKDLKVTNTTTKVKFEVKTESGETKVDEKEVEYSALEGQVMGAENNPGQVTFTNNLFSDTGSKLQGIVKDESFICILKIQYLNGTTWKDNLTYLVDNDKGYSIKIMQQSFNFSGVLNLAHEKILNASNVKKVEFASSFSSVNNPMWYDAKQGYYWFKFKMDQGYSQTQINNLIELKDADGNLNDDNTSETLLDTLGAAITLKCKTTTSIRILDFEVFRLNIVKNKSNEDILVQPEPVSWLDYNTSSKPTISSDKLLSNYGTQPYYRYYIAPKTNIDTRADNGSSARQSKVLKYVCRRKLTNGKSTGFPLWYLYIIVNSQYLSYVNSTTTFPTNNATATEDLNAWFTAIHQDDDDITGGYIPKKGKFLTAIPKPLENYLYDNCSPNDNKFIFSKSLYLCRHPDNNVIAPCVPGVIEFTKPYIKGKKIVNNKEVEDRIELPIAYLTADLMNQPAGTYLCYDNSFNFSRDYSTTILKYFKPKPAVNANVTCAEDVTYCDIGTSVKDDIYMPVYTALKVGTVSASNSNTFNIIQKCCETFNCWAKFNVQLLSSSLTAPGDFIMKKTISLYDQYYTDISNDFSFKYQSNINSIKRTVNSEDITTKTIVKPNNNEYGKNGFCTIQRSKYNLSGENFIYNFKYYIKKKMLDETTLNRDMYGTNNISILPYMFKQNTKYDDYKQACDDQYITFCSALKKRIWTIGVSTNDCYGYIPTLHRINTKARDINDNLGIALTNKNEAYASYLVSTEAISEGEKLKAKAEDKLKQYATIDGPEKMQEIVQGVTSWTPADVLRMMQKLLADTQRFDSILETQRAIRRSTKEVYEKYDREYKMYSLLAELLEKESIFLQETFENKYHLYIQEGTWTSEDYYDDDKYYLDAASVAYTSGFPKITYQIEVEPLINTYGSTFFGGTNYFSCGYRLEPGYKTFIEDTDYFKDENGHAFKEEVIISETAKYLDSPEKNTITVQNFRTQFEDLFQRIAATTANLEFAQGMYARAASLINPDGSLQPQAIEKTFTNAKTISLTTDSSVVTGENGIIATNTKNPSEQTQLCGSGLRCTANGGKTWMTAITGNGINANAITSGQIATDKIFIGDPNNPQFKWDSEGITSFCEGVSTNNYKYLNYYKFTRLNDLGFYGIDQVHTSGTTPNNGYYLRSNVTVNNNLKESDYTGDSIPPMESSNLLLNPQCIFYVGWAGFKFKSGDTISMEGLYFDNTNGLVMRDSGGKQRLQIGPLTKEDNNTIYGFAIKDTGGHPVLFNLAKTNNSGIIGITGSINILPIEAGYNVDSTLLKMGYTSSTGLKFNQEVCNITTSKVTGTKKFLNPSILELTGKYSIIGNANKEPGVETTFYQYYTDGEEKNLIGSLRLSTHDSTTKRYWDIDKGEDGLAFYSSGGYTDLTLLETTVGISSSNYCQWGMRLEHSSGIYINMTNKKFGSFFSVNAQDELQSMKYIGTVTLRAFGGYKNCYYPTLSFVAMPVAKQKQGCIFTPDIFVCKGLYSDNIECKQLLTKSISTGSSTEYMTISNLSSSNLCAVNIYSNPQGKTIYIKDSILFGSDPNKKISANFSNADLTGGTVTIYDKLAFSIGDSNNKPVVDFNNANIKNFTLTQKTWTNLIISGWTNPAAVWVQLPLGNQFSLALDKAKSIIGIYYKSIPFITGKYNSSTKTISDVELGGGTIA